MVLPGYTHIWDCCCDHGLLGATLLERNLAPFIHFVDIVPQLMIDIEKKLLRFHPEDRNLVNSPQWKVHCLDVATLPIIEHSGKHLVIIAGVGGDLITHFIQAISRCNPTADIHYLLCPVHHLYHVRKSLIDLDFYLLDERLIKENRRFYELLLVTPSKPSADYMKVSPVGEKIWQTKSAEQTTIANDYLKNTLNHYHRTQTGSAFDTQPIIDAYKSVVVG